MKFSPGECFQVDLYEIVKTDYITVVDKATGLIMSQKLANKEAGITIRALENIFPKVCPSCFRRTTGRIFLKEFEKFSNYSEFFS